MSGMNKVIEEIQDAWDELGEEPESEFEKQVADGGRGLDRSLDTLGGLSDLASRLQRLRVRACAPRAG